ncbi:hypothetical protein ACFQGT_17440 [Natrialbaceae archaeon GCM10025810]|uniref:hypothetical protein n=1 Tax=Halovalidus salilacus TaxID=3075124 RepID=UPI003615C7FD
MRALQACDFCGADAVGAFEVVPPELEPTEAEQRRVVLCGACRSTLEDLLEPLIARASAGSGAGDDRRKVAPDSDRDDGGRVVASADETTAKRQPSASPNATVSDAGSDDRRRGRDRSEPRDSLLEDGITLEQTSNDAEPDATDDGAESEPERPASEDAESGADRAAGGGAASKSETAADDGARSDAEDAPAPPRGYGKVMRLLRNREFPVDRGAVETLAASAYDLESHEVEAILEHALERGELAADGSKLRRP